MTRHCGGCLCGAVKYSFDSEPIMTGVCHCENCQRQSGTAFSIIVGVAKSSFEIEDTKTLSEYIDQGANGSKVRRQFCNNCGSPIISLIESAPELCMLKAGTLDDKSWLEPTIHFWCDSAQPWIEIPDSILKFDRNPS
ncbi:MAG: hypothetical protein ACI90U_000771 [Pseudomonadales bacterium]|jgi:hypothetical protein